MPTYVAIVDDRHPSITYAGSWTGAGTLEEFNTTTTFSTTQEATASFTFVGTSITVYATVAAINPPQASLNFAIDNNSTLTGSYTPPGNMTADIHHTALWESPTLSNGTHTLVITQTAAQAAGVIFLDYFMYNTTSTEVDAYFIDDSDPRVSYTPAWQHFVLDEDFQHTSQESTNPGDMFSLTFQGKAIEMYGGITNIGMKASMVVDGGVAEIFAPSSLPQSAANNLIFSSGVLKDGNHTLVVTSEGTSPMSVDYFLVTPSTLSSASPTLSGSSSSSSPTLPATSPTTKPKPTPVGAIVGGAVGGLVVMALAAAAIFFSRRRARNRWRAALESPDLTMEQHDVLPTPFSDFPAPRSAAVSGPSLFATAGSSTTPFPSAGSSHTENHSTSALSASSHQLAYLPCPAAAPAPNASATPGPSSDFGGAPARPLPAPLPRKLAEEARRREHFAPSRPGTRSQSSSTDGLISPGGGEAPPLYSE
ncbi:hypothetical protein B0H11DRAFT_2272160 [Mycena galericulata]|nr:hypothetical protein B0H11DRAFT_2272160 [Mycena galericulata]